MGNTGIHGTCLSSREDATSRPVSTCARPWSPSWSVILLTLTAQLQTPNRGALILGNFCRRRHTDSRELCAVVRSCMMAPPCEQSSIRSDSPPCIGRGAGGRAKHRRSGLRVQREPPWDRRHEPEAQLESGHHRARVDAERLPHPSGKQLVRSERREPAPVGFGESPRDRVGASCLRRSGSGVERALLLACAGLGREWADVAMERDRFLGDGPSRCGGLASAMDHARRA